MKKTIIILMAVLAISSFRSAAWGRLGHATIAEIAERHLTPEAKKVIMEYTGGASLASFSSWMDEVAGQEPYKTELAGWHASIADENCKSPLYIRKEYRNARDGVTAMNYFREYLEDYKEMDDSLVFDAIKCMTHIVGDFHCPQHVRYTDCHNQGYYQVIVFGKSEKYHSFWDSGVIQRGSGLKWNQYKEYADRLDTWNKRQIKACTKGWAREWFEDAARDVRPTINTVKDGDVLGQEYIDSHIGLAEQQICKAGYQLAKALNEIFGK